MYTNRRVGQESLFPDERQYTWFHPVFFFTRRAVFITVSIYWIDRPVLQMLTQQCITMLAVVFLCSQEFSSRLYKWVEISTEMLLLATSVFIQECIRLDNSKESTEEINKAVILTICLLIGLNIFLMLFVSVSNCRASCRRKKLEKLRTQKLTEARDLARKRSIQNLTQLEQPS